MYTDETDPAGDAVQPEPAQEIQALIKNGLEFLDKAREELDAGKPKFSIVSFWTAVEILLKVPLIHEHWTLVCSGKKIVRKNYLAGDFQSVTFDETCARLGDVLERPLPKETIAVFNKIRQHRNRVVHFYHSAFTDDDLKQILREQADAWFVLNRLMRDEWPSVFGAGNAWRLAYGETRLIRGNAFYAEARFNLVRSELEQLAGNGGVITPCPECNQHAVVQKTVDTGNKERELRVLQCRVCSGVSRHLLFFCPECDEPVSLSEGEEDFICESCEATLERYELLDEESFSSSDEAMYSPFPAGCTGCMNPNTVCPFGDGYLCTQCLAWYEELSACECCGHSSDSVPEFSHIKGCEFCEGDTRFHAD